MNCEMNQEKMPAEALRILVADDRPDVLEALRLLLKDAGHKTETVNTPQTLLHAAASDSFDLILMDMNYSRDTTSGTDGLMVLDCMQEQKNTTPIIVMTAWGSIDLAVEAMRHGASDFVQKPWDNNRLLCTLDKQARAAITRRHEEKRARKDIEIAHQVQQKLFPQKTNLLKTAEYTGCCVPAYEVGGDYYDFLDLGPGSMGLVLADVSGKGVAAALLMSNLQGCFRSQVSQHASTPALLSEVNRLFCASTSSEQYATVFFSHYDDRTRRLQYVNCGHMPPILARADGTIERLEDNATVLGIFDDWSCTKAAVDLAPGDTLVLYSDGITDSGIDSECEFGENRLMAMITAGQSQPLKVMVDEIIKKAREYSIAKQTDDMTVVRLRMIHRQIYDYT
jgi:phosphoserine phosphatase RsbU/P